uniref:Retrovirus-related Pol polyprotein from transposon TNT 1-94 n=1 Tax=Cajanus cajan TaxID=3821 RepID=A0A151TEA1_CAJCA|nr:Retrovirus-related Pol polyprotein from transposon TNT 1-94 [Cajanus cajan]
MASTIAVKPDSSIFTNYANVPLFIDKLDGTNYDTWASDIKFWLKGQDYVALLTQTAASVYEKNRPRWSKIDAQICSVLKSTIHPSLKQIFYAHETCVDVWEQARLLYTNNTQRLYGACQNLPSIFLCDHCHKLGHTIDRCYVLHGRPTCLATAIVHVASLVSIASSATSSDSFGFGPPTFFHDFLKWYEERQASNSTTTSTPVGLVVDSPSLIHAQLGHPSLAKLQHLVPRLSKLSHLSCKSCQLGKHSRCFFSQSVPSRMLSLFALVHSDIWGSSRVRSTLGFHYFVTFIDDYSRCTWLFLMKTQSELFSICQSLYNEIQKQFGVSIRTFRSDNACEFPHYITLSYHKLSPSFIVGLSINRMLKMPFFMGIC